MRRLQHAVAHDEIIIAPFFSRIESPTAEKLLLSQCSLIKAITCIGVGLPARTGMSACLSGRTVTGIVFVAAARPVVPSSRDNRGWGRVKPGIVSPSSFIHIQQTKAGSRRPDELRNADRGPDPGRDRVLAENDDFDIAQFSKAKRIEDVLAVDRWRSRTGALRRRSSEY